MYCQMIVCALATSLLPGTLLWMQDAGKAISVPRADHGTTPLMVYAAKGVPSGSCAPLAVISHGMGGSELGYGYLAEDLAQHGYTAIVMGHRESGMAAVSGEVRTHGVRGGIQSLLTDPNAESARLLDVGAALRWAESQCQTPGHIPFRVLLGHSMGAATVMLEAGAKNKIGISSPPSGQSRFDAYVALSPQGPGSLFPENAWQSIRKPMLVMTGTKDDAAEGGAESRQIPWQILPGGHGKCQWLGVMDGATHMNFAGLGLGADRVEPITLATMEAFLHGVRDSSCVLPTPNPEMRLQAK